MKEKIEQRVSGLRVVLTLVIWIISSAFVGMETYFLLRSWAPIWATTDNIAIAIVAEVYFLFLVAAFVVFGGFKGLRDKLSFKFTNTKDIWLVLKWYGAGLGACVIVYLLLSPVIGPLPNTLLQILRKASDMSRLSSAGFFAWFLIIMRACILAPLTEELLFRGLLFGWLRSYFRPVVTIIITTLLFAGMHFYPILYPVAILFGLISGWVRERTGSSLNFVIAHIVNSVLFLIAAYVLVTFFKVSPVC
ncbi:MAG TPA: type II CAAX endopeptidase family protein [Mucilaginibacter sp.]|jgi:membrane protease YdiL (CAAX protease family)|nr:type II CAAX endopeptidase family protein [Mucilaginibacter sp.]